MDDEHKTREQLLEELRALRAELQQVEAERQQAEDQLRASTMYCRASALPPDHVEQRETMEKLRQSERRLAEAQRVARIGSWERDLRTDQVTWSDELYRLFGRDPRGEAVPYEEFLSCLVPEDIAPTRQVVEQALRDGRPFACDYRIITPDGTRRIVHDRGELIRDEAGQPLRLVGTAQDVTERRQAEVRQRQYADSLQALSRRLVEVQEEERRHLARELHDEIGQVLTSLKFALEASAAAPPEAVQAKIGEAQALIGDVLNRVRELSFDLRPALLDHFGLLPALRWLLDRYTASTGVRVDFQHAGLEERLAAELEVTAYRVVQEALTNIARHAQVRQAAVRLWADAETLTIQVEEEGVGFDPEAVMAAGRSSGLTGMHERVRLLGGRLAIDSAPGAGSHLLAELPLRGQPCAKIMEHFQRLGG
jgi:PAS domain S-box-containing protein